jgi:hypothetical protein
MNSRDLVAENICTLTQAVDLIEGLADEVYANNASDIFVSGVGRHMRHVLDFYRCFIQGYPGRIDYDRRLRSTAIETERRVAVSQIKAIMEALKTLADEELEVVVKNDDVRQRRDEAGFNRSTVVRELQFLSFHAIHHYCLKTGRGAARSGCGHYQTP